MYGIKGQGLKKAIDRAVRLRQTFEWCVKTDIQAFFDNIPRAQLKKQITQRLRGSSTLPLLFAAIDREIEPRNETQRIEIQEAGIIAGIGVRQGMPLSPVLANFALTKFDSACKRANMHVLRYADDILAFFASKADATQGFELVKAELAKLQLEVPELGTAKTELIGNGDPVTFLGREIVYLGSENRYVARVGKNKLDAIQADLIKKFELQRVIGESKTLGEAAGALAASVRSYLGSYKDAQNFAHFNSEMRHAFRIISQGWFFSIFGENAIAALSHKQKLFLGIDSTEKIEPVEDVEISS